MIKIGAKGSTYTWKSIFSKIDKSSIDRVHISNKSFIFFFLCLLISMFLKIYISNLVVIEAKNVDALKYRLKITESELKKIKKDLAKYSEKDILLDYSKNLNNEEKIDLVVVKE
ncbi:MAG: hypothetical protein N2202_04515 [Proteobacteria bacterium]|nr:hypothetical protein [Pseudomonadota bacterium]